MKTLIEYKYQVLCFALFASLAANISLFHTNRIYEAGILRAMDIIGLYENPHSKWNQKENMNFLLEYLEELSWSNPEE